MVNKRKIFNDPVYGFITIPYDIIFELIEHPYFQRLRHISQLGLTEYVYPGARHTRFHHALGAMHLMTQTIDVLRNKSVEITEAEAIGVTIAILLHDIGHGPFSHTLEHHILDEHHETLTLLFMNELNEQFDGQLKLAIEIFEGKYPKKFLHQLVSGQLDMDRMDYLNRDSYFTGVSEGVIGYDRIIKMLNVADGGLVVEEKGIYSVENFLIARRLMYWQVYLHKTVVAAEQMLIQIFRRIKHLKAAGITLDIPPDLSYFIYEKDEKCDFKAEPRLILSKFANISDHDIFFMIKFFANNDKSDETLSYLSQKLINRELFKIKLQSEAINDEQEVLLKSSIVANDNFSGLDHNFLIIKGKEHNSTYTKNKDEINILQKNRTVLPLSEITEDGITSKSVTKYFICYAN